MMDMRAAGTACEAFYPYAFWDRAEFESLHVGPTTRPSQDLVFFQGQFVQWPNVGLGP